MTYFHEFEEALLRAHQRVCMAYGGVDNFTREVVAQLPVTLDDNSVFELAGKHGWNQSMLTTVPGTRKRQRDEARQAVAQTPNLADVIAQMSQQGARAVPTPSTTTSPDAGAAVPAAAPSAKASGSGGAPRPLPEVAVEQPSGSAAPAAEPAAPTLPPAPPASTVVALRAAPDSSPAAVPARPPSAKASGGGGARRPLPALLAEPSASAAPAAETPRPRLRRSRPLSSFNLAAGAAPGAVSKAAMRRPTRDDEETETEDTGLDVAIEDKDDSQVAPSSEEEPEVEAELCQFCLQPMQVTEEFLKVLPCGHKYHEECLESWDRMNPRPAHVPWRCPNRCHVSSNSDRPQEDIEPPVIPLPASDDEEDLAQAFA